MRNMQKFNEKMAAAFVAGVVLFLIMKLMGA